MRLFIEGSVNFGKGDFCLWGPSTSKAFSCKYFWVFGGPLPFNHPVFSSLWSVKFSRVKFFTGQVLQERINTLYSVLRILFGLMDLQRCILYRGAMEYFNHHLGSCVFTRLIWMVSSMRFSLDGRGIPLSPNFLWEGSIFWLARISAMLWSIWLERNNKVFFRGWRRWCVDSCYVLYLSLAFDHLKLTFWSHFSFSLASFIWSWRLSFFLFLFFYIF